MWNKVVAIILQTISDDSGEKYKSDKPGLPQSRDHVI